MILFPAIDMKDNQCVRLRQGNFKDITVYSNHPDQIARAWEEQGANFLHLVDLDGAKDEKLINQSCIEEMIKSVDAKVQVGGGIRTYERVKELLDLGVERVIVGTIAIEKPELLKQLVKDFKERIVVSIDAKDGYVALRGWEVMSDQSSIEVCKELEKIGVETIVYTDISKDGMMKGPNFKVYKELSQKTNLNIIASGGISSIEDLKKLKKMELYGAIMGKALYDGKIDLKEAYKCLQDESFLA